MVALFPDMEAEPIVRLSGSAVNDAALTELEPTIGEHLSVMVRFSSSTISGRLFGLAPDSVRVMVLVFIDWFRAHGGNWLWNMQLATRFG